MYVNYMLKIGIPIMIVLLMLVVVGTGLLLARQNTSALARPTASYAGYTTGTWVGCGGYCTGAGAGYGPGGNSGNYPSCHGY
jgi:hypothetical protein